MQQAPMGGLSTPALAAAVADAGAVGTVSAFGLDPSQLEQLLDDVRARTDGVVAANFMTDDIDPAAVSLVAGRVQLVDFFWTDPDAELVRRVHEAGALACWQVGSLDEALAAQAAGCDVVAVQGVEAGGHVRGNEPRDALVRAAVDGLRIPVLAAGGVSDAQSVKQALDAGAAGVRVGTRFLATHESGAHDTYKHALVAATSDATEITDAFAVCPLCATVPRARVLRTCITAVRAATDEVVGQATFGGQRMDVPRGHGLPPLAATTGNIEAMAMYASESVQAITEIQPAGKVVHDLTAALD
jgi:nitronate monooxygenase